MTPINHNHYRFPRTCREAFNDGFEFDQLRKDLSFRDSNRGSAWSIILAVIMVAILAYFGR